MAGLPANRRTEGRAPRRHHTAKPLVVVDRTAERWRVATLMSPAIELQRAAESLKTLSGKARVAADAAFVPPAGPN